MTRQATPLYARDLGAFARSLAAQLALAHEKTRRTPSHVELLNMLARAAGHRNFQTLRARPPKAPIDEPLSETAVKALRQFDADGRLVRWPIKFSVQRLMLWGLWMRFDPRRRYAEQRDHLIARECGDSDDGVCPRRGIACLFGEARAELGGRILASHHE